MTPTHPARLAPATLALFLGGGAALAATSAEDTGNNNSTTANAQAADPGSDCFHLLAGYTSTYADIDYYSAAALLNERLWIATDTGGARYSGTTGRDTVLSLYGDDGSTLIETDDDDGTGTGGDASVESDAASAIAGRLVSSSADHYIRLTSGDSERVDPYLLLVATTAGSDLVETESNDTIGQADGPNGCDTAVSGALSSSADVDVYAVTLATGQRLWVMADEDPERDGSNTDLELNLLDSGGAAIFTANIDGSGAAGGGQPTAESFTYTAPATASYYVRVSANTGVSGSYRLLIAPSTEAPLTVPAIDRSGAGGGGGYGGGVFAPALAALFGLLASLRLRRRRPE